MQNALITALFGFLATMWLFVVAVLVFIIIARWKVFKKAGKQGWESIVPFYSTIVLLDIIGYKWYYIFVFFMSAIPVVGWVIVLVFNISYNIKLAKAYGQETAFGIGLWLVPVVFLAILGFSKDIKYVGKTVNGDIDFNDMF